MLEKIGAISATRELRKAKMNLPGEATDQALIDPSGAANLAALCAVARFHQIAADPAALALMRPTENQAGPRFVVLSQCDGQRVLYQDMASVPGSKPGPSIESVDAFAGQWAGQLILISSRASLAGELAKFDFSWFIPSLVKYRSLLGDGRVCAASNHSPFEQLCHGIEPGEHRELDLKCQSGVRHAGRTGLPQARPKGQASRRRYAPRRAPPARLLLARQPVLPASAGDRAVLPALAADRR